MTRIRYTLLCDGSSDKVLTYVIDWALHQQHIEIESSECADFRQMPKPPRGLAERAWLALEMWPCDLLFVHRDAEREPLEARLEEIRKALDIHRRQYVPVVPVRMTEAWLLHDHAAIRRAAGNPNGRADLRLPRTRRLEKTGDPKEVLWSALEAASEAKGRRLKKVRQSKYERRLAVAEFIDDWGPLRALPAFSRFLDDLEDALKDSAPG